MHKGVHYGDMKLGEDELMLFEVICEYIAHYVIPFVLQHPGSRKNYYILPHVQLPESPLRKLTFSQILQ